MLDFSIFGLEVIFSYLKSTPSNLSNCKILQKDKNAEIWDQKYFVGVFLRKNFKIAIARF